METNASHVVNNESRKNVASEELNLVLRHHILEVSAHGGTVFLQILLILYKNTHQETFT